MADELVNLQQGYDLLSSDHNVIVDEDLLAQPGMDETVQSLLDEFHAKVFEEIGETCFTEVTTDTENGLSMTTYENGGAIVVEKDDFYPGLSQDFASESVIKVEEPAEPESDTSTYAYEKDGIVAVSSCAPPKLM